MQSLMSNREFLSVVQEFMALQAVTVSTVRGLRRRGKALKNIREYLERLPLERLVRRDGQDYAHWLDVHTRRIQKKLGGRKEQWGVARKAMNLFMRQCLYNTYLSRKFRLARFQKQMEIPLDNRVARKLRADAGKKNKKLKWKNLKALDRKTSQEFQEHAKDMAARDHLPARVFLDHYLWL